MTGLLVAVLLQVAPDPLVQKVATLAGSRDIPELKRNWGLIYDIASRGEPAYAELRRVKEQRLRDEAQDALGRELREHIALALDLAEERSHRILSWARGEPSLVTPVNVQRSFDRFVREGDWAMATRCVVPSDEATAKRMAGRLRAARSRGRYSSSDAGIFIKKAVSTVFRSIATDGREVVEGRLVCESCDDGLVRIVRVELASDGPGLTK